MNRINTIFTLYSLVVVIIIVERLLPYTRVTLAPYNFIAVHQLIQTLFFIPFTLILSLLTMKIITNDFQTLKEKSNAFFALLFVIGAYLYGAGEGWHEVSLFTLNTYCHLDYFMNNLCGGLFINSYYSGNLIFFIGGLIMGVSLLSLAKKHPTPPFTKKELIILIINSSMFAFTWFAYAAFDKVSIGFVFSALLMLISLSFFLVIRKKWKSYPFILYSVLAYSLATIAICIVRFF